MPSVRSPLGALGAVIVLLEAIAAGSLSIVADNLTLSWILTIVIALSVVAVVLTVLWMIMHFAKTSPGLLFPASDIDPSVHKYLYQKTQPGDEVTYEIVQETDDIQQ